MMDYDITEAPIKSRDSLNSMWDIMAQPSAVIIKTKFVQQGQRPCQDTGPFCDDFMVCVCVTTGFLLACDYMTQQSEAGQGGCVNRQDAVCDKHTENHADCTAQFEEFTELLVNFLF